MGGRAGTDLLGIAAVVEGGEGLSGQGEVIVKLLLPRPEPIFHPLLLRPYTPDDQYTHQKTLTSAKYVLMYEITPAPQKRPAICTSYSPKPLNPIAQKA
jgi:hypothetical protein